MGVFVVRDMVEHILAKASKEGVFGLCIPSFIVNLITNKVCGILRFWEALCGGSKHSNIYGF